MSSKNKMVYEWDQKRDECYVMYITQNRSLDEIIDFYRERNFAPSKRAFQARFKEWEFPAKHRPAHKDADLKVRIRELWEVNTGNKQMLDILRGEGWDVKERELTKLRKEQNLLLREPNRIQVGKGNGTKRKKTDDLDRENEENETPEKRIRTPTPQPTIDPEIIAKRQARQARLLAESQERLKAGTRRRRTKVWSGLPPDPEAPPRYPSELTMEENKRELGLDKTMYQEMRDIFEDICRNNNIIKKTLCGSDAWKNVKDQLISRMPHLQAIFWGPGAAAVEHTQQPMALDLICMDVTKKIRSVGSRVTISAAKNILALTPQEGRDIRNAFDAILKGDHFVSKLEVPREHWEGLKASWFNGSPLIQQKLSGGVTDPDYATKLKCLESIACDVQKRHRDHQTKNDPTLTKTIFAAELPPTTPAQTPSTNQTKPPVPFPANKTMAPPTPNLHNLPSSPHGTRATSARTYRHPAGPPLSMPPEGMTTLASQALASASHPQPSFLDYSNMQIDPTLLEAAALPEQNHHHQRYGNDDGNSPMIEDSMSAEIPVYFRLSPLSSLRYLNSHPKVWLSTLSPPYSVDSLKELALAKTTIGTEARVGKIEGLASGGGVGVGVGVGVSVGGNDAMVVGGRRWSIDEDDELEAYLEMVGSGKVSFVVEIV